MSLKARYSLVAVMPTAVMLPVFDFLRELTMFCYSLFGLWTLE